MLQREALDVPEVLTPRPGPLPPLWCSHSGWHRHHQPPSLGLRGTLDSVESPSQSRGHLNVDCGNLAPKETRLHRSMHRALADTLRTKDDPDVPHPGPSEPPSSLHQRVVRTSASRCLLRSVCILVFLPWTTSAVSTVMSSLAWFSFPSPQRGHSPLLPETPSPLSFPELPGRSWQVPLARLILLALMSRSGGTARSCGWNMSSSQI